MAKAIYINLAVNNLEQSKRFFEALDYRFRDDFSNEFVAALAISDSITAMLHTHESIKQYTAKNITNTHQSTEVLLGLQLESRRSVDQLIAKVIAAGGREYRCIEDHGFMYERSFEDLDGHIWEVFWMNPNT